MGRSIYPVGGKNHILVVMDEENKLISLITPVLGQG